MVSAMRIEPSVSLTKRNLHRGFTLVELLVVIAIIGILASLIMPAISSARESARRMSCGSNLRQIGIALVGYNNAYRQLPATVLPNGGTGWISILPQIDEAPLYNQFNFSLPMTSLPNSEARRNTPGIYICPSTVFPERFNIKGLSSYAFSTGSDYYRFSLNKGAMVDSNNIFRNSRAGAFMGPTNIADMSSADGSSHVLLAGELSFTLRDVQPNRGFTQWAEGYPFHSAGSMAGRFNAFDNARLDFRTWETFRSHHVGVVQFVMCDGSVQVVNEAIDATVLDNLADRDDGKTTGRIEL